MGGLPSREDDRVFSCKLTKEGGGTDDSDEPSSAIVTDSLASTVISRVRSSNLNGDILELNFEARASLIFLRRSLNEPITMVLSGSLFP